VIAELLRNPLSAAGVAERRDGRGNGPPDLTDFGFISALQRRREQGVGLDGADTEVDRWPQHVPPWPHQLATSAAYWSAASSQVEWPTSMMSSMLRGSGPSMTRNRIWKDVFSQLITASLLLVSSGPGPEIASLPGSGWEGRARLRQWRVQMARVGRPGLHPDQAGGGG
jgi:hypothetical protein